MNVAHKEEQFKPLTSKNVRSKERVRDLAEVFTAEREVNAMLDLIGDPTYDVDATVLEPSCGNGNFLSVCLDRKMSTVFQRKLRGLNAERAILRSAMSLYGVDISPGNVLEARERLQAQVLNAWSMRMNTRNPSPDFMAALRAVLAANIVTGDFLNGKHEVVFTEFMPIGSTRFSLKDFRLSNIGTPIRIRGAGGVADIPRLLSDSRPVLTSVPN